MPVVIERPETVSEAELFASLNDIANRSAFILAIDDETLHDWFLKQVGWWGAHAAKLSKARETAGQEMRWYELTARLENAVETIVLLREKQHVLCCRLHGVQGVDFDPDWWPNFPADESVPSAAASFAALADRGVFDGDWTGWERPCEKCLQPLIKAEALRRFQEAA